MSVAHHYEAVMKSLADVDAASVLPGWKRPVDALKACFWRYDVNGNPVSVQRGGNEDYDRVFAARPAAGWRTAVFLSYENPKGASGGILAVIRRLPAEMQRLLLPSQPGTPREFLRLSPHHTHLSTQYPEGALQPLGTCRVHFDGREVEVRVSRFQQGDEVWHLFGADGFFAADGGAGGKDPYIHSRETGALRDGDQSLLLRDSLFACQAVPAVLALLGQTDGLIVHAQDWEFASAALTVREALLEGTLRSAAVVLTLHNPYDHGLSEAGLAKISPRHAGCHWPRVGGQDRPTVLTRMIPLLDAPASVVSHQSARELTSSPLQTGVFTRHLQGAFRTQGLVGIDNGAFRDATAHFSPAAIAAAHAGKPAAILAEKRAKRQAMLAALTGYLKRLDEAGARRDPRTLTLGDLTGGEGRPLTELPDDVPVFMMVGRLDPGQKGYDLCVQLIGSMPPGAARFILTPMSPLAHDPAVRPFFDQLQELATARPGDVVVFAHQMDAQTYNGAMAGATYSLWPSRYEPFGGVSEFYAACTPAIAHGVGGLVQQVIGFDEAVADATGFVYRDTQWRGVDYPALEQEYAATHRAPPYARPLVPEYRSECALLRATVLNATAVFQEDDVAYGRILANLGDMLAALRWDQPVRDYLTWYEKALG